MLEHFHFLHPEWLLALIPLGLVFWFIKQRGNADSGWTKVIDPRLLPVLLQSKQVKKGRTFSALLILAWVFTVLALANPVWEKRAVPVFQTDTARVIVLDLSTSMLIPDVKPNRLARARFKIEDILSRQEEGQIGLVAFAGDAFTVSPLTRDADTIRVLLQSLSPDTLPVQGSRADFGLQMAMDLMKQAGVPEGQIILIADGAKLSDGMLAAEQADELGYKLSVLSVGTKEGAPIPGLRDKQGKPIVVGTQQDELEEIAKAGNGRFRTMTGDSSDIDYLLASVSRGKTNKAEKSEDMQNQDWQSEGPWLVLLLLPLAALAFRRGWLLSIALVVITLGQPQPVMASVWDSLWQRQDQQADKALQAKQYEQAQELAEDPLRRGSAAYKQGEYEKALSDFIQAEGADAAYNKGNALAQLGKYEEAVKAYDDALKVQPDMQDALDNKKIIEELLKQQQEQEKQNQQQENQQNQNQDQQQQQENQDKNQQQSGEGQEDPNSPQNQQQAENQAEQGEEQEKQGQQGEEQENQFANANEEQKEAEEQQAEEEALAAQQQDQEHKTAEQREQEQAREQALSAQQEATESDTEQGSDKEGLSNMEADELNSEEKLAAEQWLRRIPDDPGGLLKRKFRHQYRLRERSSQQPRELPW